MNPQPLMCKNSSEFLLEERLGGARLPFSFLPRFQNGIHSSLIWRVIAPSDQKLRCRRREARRGISTVSHLQIHPPKNPRQPWRHDNLTRTGNCACSCRHFPDVTYEFWTEKYKNVSYLRQKEDVVYVRFVEDRSRTRRREGSRQTILILCQKRNQRKWAWEMKLGEFWRLQQWTYINHKWLVTPCPEMLGQPPALPDHE